MLKLKLVFSFGFTQAAILLTAAGAEPPKDLPAGPKPPAFRAPKDWTKVDPAPLASARFQIGDKDQGATVVVLAAPRFGGGLASNVNRWRAQLGLEAVPDELALKALRPIQVGGVPGHSLDLTGPTAHDKPATRIRAVIVKRGDQTWFFKMMGPAKLVDEQGEAFDGFIRSVRFEG
jgi:hypothetical protein